MKHLTAQQRYTISVMLANKFSITEIAKAIGKDKSVVSREIKRNCDKRSGEYKYELAQKKYEQRMKEKPKKRYFTEEMKIEIEAMLKQDWSPEQIVHRLKKEGKAVVSHERIYQHIWTDKKQGGELYKHLRRRGRRYRKRGLYKDTRGIIKERIGIEHRPEIVNKKQRIGDLEIDTIIGKNHKGAILSITDRVSSKVWLAKLSAKNASELARQTINLLAPYKDLIHTITADNGKEFAQHRIISQELNVCFYFANPYHAWERGANENTNGLIRQYFPKSYNFDLITEQDIKYVENMLNNRPRKKLNFLTPNEFFSQYLQNHNVAFVT